MRDLPLCVLLIGYFDDILLCKRRSLVTSALRTVTAVYSTSVSWIFAVSRDVVMHDSANGIW